jgi:hypothetical protein
MASNFDFSTGITSSPFLDKIQRGDRMQDDLPRRRDHFREKPDRKDSDDESSEDITTSDGIGTEIRRLDLRV